MRELTLFEWAGGAEALGRMTRIFYDEHVPKDPLLGPLFAAAAPDHPERVATWLGEVFGGPEAYTDGYGGYRSMLSHHVGKALSEEQRTRWVQLLCRSADEAGLPTDPEFRASFVAYVEWGSRIAVENSQPGAEPPPEMPVPRWSWLSNPHPRARPPVAAESVDAPAGGASAEDGLSFVDRIKPLFREGDRRSMRFAFDLWSYDDVRDHAPAILERLAQGTMPCDGAWPADRVAVFRRWVESGMPE